MVWLVLFSGVELLVNESSEGGYSIEFPSGTAAAERRKNPLHIEGKERDRHGERE